MINDNVDTSTDKTRQEVSELSLLDSFLVSIRIAGSIGAVAAIVLGVILAYQLFGLFRGLIEDPTAIIGSWQQAMDSGRPVQTRPTIDAEAAPTPTSSQSTGENTVETVGDVALPVEELGTTESTPHDVIPEVSPDVPVVADTHSEIDDLPAVIAFADKSLDRLEVGEFSWLIGVAVLVMFCWLLVKIPAMLITAGTRLLLGLVNVNADAN